MRKIGAASGDDRRRFAKASEIEIEVVAPIAHQWRERILDDGNLFVREGSVCVGDDGTGAERTFL
jgi:hypothetical protein